MLYPPQVRVRCTDTCVGTVRTVSTTGPRTLRPLGSPASVFLGTLEHTAVGVLRGYFLEKKIMSFNFTITLLYFICTRELKLALRGTMHRSLQED